MKGSVELGGEPTGNFQSKTRRHPFRHPAGRYRAKFSRAGDTTAAPHLHSIAHGESLAFCRDLE